MINLKRLSKNETLVMACVWFAAIVALLSDSLNAFALYGALPIAFIATYSSYRKLQVNKYFNMLMVLYIWIAFSVIWATDTDVALRQMKQILGSTILCYIFAVNVRKENNTRWLYLVYFWTLIFMWYYAYHNIFDNIELGQNRVDDEKLNANTLAYYTFYFTFASYKLGEVDNSCCFKKIMRGVFLSTIPLSFYTAILTASRQVLIIQLPLIIILLYIRYIKGKNVSRKMLLVFAIGVSSLIVAPSILNTYNNSYLSTRNESDIEDDERTKLAKDAFQVGLEHFPFGVGPGNYLVHSYNKHFSHNTYLELWANEGIIGLFIYLSMLIAFFKRQWKRYKKYRDDIFLSFLMFGIFFAIDGLFYSFYENLWLIGFFILVASHSEMYYKEKIKSLK